jgi:hypothetical protein
MIFKITMGKEKVKIERVSSIDWEETAIFYDKMNGITYSAVEGELAELPNEALNALKRMCEVFHDGE